MPAEVSQTSEWRSGISEVGGKPVEAVRVESESLSAVEPTDLVHVALGQLEVEDVEVVREPSWIAGLRDDDVAKLKVPAEHHLRRCSFHA